MAKLSWNQWRVKHCGEAPPVFMAAPVAPLAADPDAAYRAEYEADKVRLSRLGITLEEFIGSRRIDANGGQPVKMQAEPAFDENAAPYAVGSRYCLPGEFQ